MRRALIAILVVAAVATGGWFGYQRIAVSRSGQAPDFEVVNIVRGNITSTVSATGKVLGEREANLGFLSAGSIGRIHVAVGDRVAAGKLLAELDTVELQLTVRQAQVGLRTAQAQLQQLKAPANAIDLSAAQAALSSAQTAYQQLLDGPNADQLAAGRAAVEQARVARDQAQQAYDRIKDQPNACMFPQALQLQQATINYETAQANFRVTSRGATEAQLAASQTQVVQAQAALDRLRRGPSKEQLDIAQAAVDQAQIAVEQAQRRLDNTKLTAPWAGVVTAVNVTEGGLAQPGAPAIGLADLSRFHVNVKIDEVDIASIAEGQPASVELDSLPGNRLAGRVSKIAPAPAADPTGLIAYQVTIFIDPTDAALRTGMSATVTITSNSRQNVLLMPNRAVQVERETGKTYVERSVDGASQRVEVRLGLRDEQQSEVREGLADGDRVIIRIVSTRARLEQTFGGFSGGR